MLSRYPKYLRYDKVLNKNQKENIKNKLKESIFKISDYSHFEYKISHVLASDNSNVKLSGKSHFLAEKDIIDNAENIEKDCLIPLESRVDFLISNKKNENKENFYFSTNKEVLEKLISDLEKVQSMMNKYKSG